MAYVYDRKGPKQVASLSVNSELLNAARESGVNLSAALEEALADKVAIARRERWVKENTRGLRVPGRTFVPSLSQTVEMPVDAALLLCDLGMGLRRFAGAAAQSIDVHLGVQSCKLSTALTE